MTRRHLLLPRMGAALLGLFLVAVVLAPVQAEAGGNYRGKMSKEFAAKIDRALNGPSVSAERFQFILIAPQSEVDRIGQKYGLPLMKRMIAGGVFLGTATQIAAVTLEPQVKSVSENVRVYSMAAVTAQAIGADQVWTGTQGAAFGGVTGRGVGVAVLDSGIANHPDLVNRVGARLDFTGTGGVRWGGVDDYGHGTHVASIIAGSGEGSRTWQRGHPSASTTAAYIGMAPGATLISAKVLSADGSGYVADVIDAIYFFARYKEFFGVRVVNLSLGHPAAEPYRNDPLAIAVEDAVRAGLVVVASAGNLGVTPAPESKPIWARLCPPALRQVP